MTPRTADDLRADLAGLGVAPGDHLLVHSSLSRIAGPGTLIVGGPVALLTALQEAVGPSGTVVMPAFSSDYSDPAAWTQPAVPASWWPTIRESMPGWRADRARTFRLGVVAETFRGLADVRRSAHPHASFCAWGARAERVCAIDRLDDPLGPDGPLGALRELGARVLLLGCGFGSCTAFHLAEHEVDPPTARRSAAAPMEVDGTRRWVRWSEPAYDPAPFAAIGAAWTARGPVRRGTVGAAVSHLFDLTEAVAFAAWELARGGLGGEAASFTKPK